MGANMSKQSKRNQPPAVPPPATKSRMPIIVGVVAIVAVAVVAVAVMRSDPTQPVASEQVASTSPAAAAAPNAPPAPEPAAVQLKPHPQKEFPPLRLPAYQLGRSPEVITAAYRFAAEHPEVLSYVPCFCGCERSGHRGNEDCFVKARGTNGDVIEWEDHGMECNVCLDVAQQAMQMYSSGASVRDIRAAVEAKWAPQAHTHTPTPAPPK
jgi:Protein of unknown function with PCYCGC motif